MSSGCLRLTALFYHIVKLLAVLLDILHHLVRITFFIDLPLTVLSNERQRFPDTIRIFKFDGRLVAVDLFIAIFNRSLPIAEKRFTLYDIVQIYALGLGLLLVHLDRIF
jgi:hypothetical protein